MKPIEARCTQGKLIVTEQSIRIELGEFNQQSLAVSALTGIDSKTVVPSIFGLGGGVDLTFHGKGGDRLKASLVRPHLAREIKSMLEKSY